MNRTTPTIVPAVTSLIAILVIPLAVGDLRATGLNLTECQTNPDQPARPRVLSGAPPVPTDPPALMADAIWYQVFVSRFRNGDPANDPPDAAPWTTDWFRLLDGEKPPLRDRLFGRRHGGDLRGVIESIGYFQSLGINTLYLNPIFSAPSQHKYDTADHRHIDDTFGVPGAADRHADETLDPATWSLSDSDRVFLELLRRCHAAGIRVVIDGVFNHVGRRFFAWQDVLANGPKSRYANWFDVTDWGPPIRYNAWDRPDGHLVEFRRDNDGLDPGVEAYIFAVTRRWMDPDGDGDPSDGVDGWRLDVAEKPPQGFWRRFRRVVKTVNPDAAIVGEIWPDATRWLQGDQFDAVTNYRFREPVIRLIGRARRLGTPTRFARDLDQLFTDHPPAVIRSMMNLLDSHDTGRAVTVLAMDSSIENQSATRPPDDPAIGRLKLAALLQFTLPGAPVIYYGDEIGMYGGNDPQCRAPMWWTDRATPGGNGALRAYYQRLCRLRRQHAALRRGMFRWMLLDDRSRVVAFHRRADDDQLVVVLNLGDHRRPIELNVATPATAHAVLLCNVNGDPGEGSVPIVASGGMLSCVLPGRSAVVLSLVKMCTKQDN